MALELAPKKIRVNCVSPGMVMTEMSQKIIESIGEVAAENVRKMHPLGIGEVEDVVDAIVFLVSNKAKWITGIDLLVDGGYSAQ